MYPDPKKVKDNRYTFRLNDYEDAHLRALANMTGEQPATLIREIVMAVVCENLSSHGRIVQAGHEQWKSPKGCKTSADNDGGLLCQNT